MSKKSKQGRPARTPADEMLGKHEEKFFLFPIILGSEWISKNHRKFRNSSGREELLAEAKRLRDEAREDVKRAKRNSSNKDALNQCYSKCLRAASNLSVARADAIELMVQYADQAYPESFASYLLEKILEVAEQRKKEAPKSWRKEFIRNLPCFYRACLESQKAERKRNDESDAVAAGAGTKYADQVRFVELNTKTLPSDYSKLTFAKAIGQYLKDYTGCTFSTRTIQRRLADFGLSDKK